MQEWYLSRVVEIVRLLEAERREAQAEAGAGAAMTVKKCP